ncbi:dihydroorotase-like cyclic amidohydrolase [Pseudomonas psychrotolerans]|uniref:Dihydroorotase-like cyclic amidohydrolase n=1 Tax=Pseudomonas oryzihabitans TaxID=47885 RepID=A0AAJ2EVM5_9PSED|nr:dihydroorotase-like cyclic amidohydrolase [Pseudomonas psychrotolerans]
MRDGVIGAISSHHQPHEADAKLAPFAATEPGISSVELLLPLALSLVADGLLDLPTLLARLTTGPARALRLPFGRLAKGQPADLVLFSQEATRQADTPWLSRGRNCPFQGLTLPGRVERTLVGGRATYRREA